jgi:hypothetical protein
VIARKKGLCVLKYVQRQEYNKRREKEWEKVINV